MEWEWNPENENFISLKEKIIRRIGLFGGLISFSQFLQQICIEK